MKPRADPLNMQDFLEGIAYMVLEELPFYPQYRNDPIGFARDILGVEWTPDIQRVALSLLTHRKTAVPAGHGVGKTHGVAGIIVWWLSTRKTVVVTTAPTWRQVIDLIWRELRAQHRRSRLAVPGRPSSVKWDLEEDWYAIGLSTNDPNKFQGYHSGELLVVMDEACGVEGFIWESIEDGLAVSEGNRILAIGNPTSAAGRFAQVCRSSDWNVINISCLNHPNVRDGVSHIQRAVSRSWVQSRIDRWCIPYQEVPGEEIPSDVFSFGDRLYTPNDMFRVRILGQFPVEGGRQIIPLHWIWRAFNREPKEPIGSIEMGMDVARFGDDNSALIMGSENGVVLAVDLWQGYRTTTSAGRVKYWVSRFQRVDNIAVDGIGYGAGVVDVLAESNYPVIDVNVASSPYDKDAYVNLRDELYFTLAGLFRDGVLDLTRVRDYEEMLTEELNAITFDYTAKGQRKIVAKEKIREQIGHSPDAADALMLWSAYLERGHITGEVVEKSKTGDWNEPGRGGTYQLQTMPNLVYRPV